MRPSADEAGHAGHDQGDAVIAASERRVRFVFSLTAGYAAVQAAGGWISGSLALSPSSGSPSTSPVP